jgi:WD40 repeat protein
MFSPEQETQLGDLMAEQTEIRYQIIRDPALTAYLDRIASRLLAELPSTGLQIQIFLIDTPVVNAFSAPGGRIYVSRKMVAFVRNEDEMAGLLGHEMGHILAHQSAIEMTLLFQKVLGVSQLASRQDLASKYNQLLDNASRGTQIYQKIAREEEPDQYIADQTALYAVANAGYAPRAVVDLFDRLAQTHGKTGSFFSNWFGLTNSSEKRLGEMQKALAAMPSKCTGASAAAAVAEFQKWQSDLIGFSGIHQRESLPGLLTRQNLNPPLRGDFTYVRFSPDGQYALAQDEASIFVLTRLPFAFLFRIDSPDAHPAAFTPDSNDIVFSTRGLRVEQWNITSQKRVNVHELAIRSGCVQSLLSPDGKAMACLSEQEPNSFNPPFSFPYFELEIFDVASGEAIFTKKRFIEMNFEIRLYFLILLLRELRGLDVVPMAYSPDSRYLVAASQSATLAVDLTTKGQISLRGGLKDMLKGEFAFLGADRMIVENTTNPAKSAILSFPSGEVVANVALGNQALAATVQSNYALLRPVANGLVGVMDVKTSKGVLALKQSSAIDLYNQQFISQGRAGEAGLFDLNGSNFTAKAALPVSPLGPLRTLEISPDFRWLAVSGDTRGAVWDLSKMKQVFSTRGFRGAFFDGNSGLYADFPKNEKVGRTVVRGDLSAADLTPVVTLDPDSTARQFGPYLVNRKPNRKDKLPVEDMTLEVSDIHDGKPLWSLIFPKDIPRVSVIPDEKRLILERNAESDWAKQEIKKDESVAKRFSAMKDHTGVFLFKILDADTGQSRGSVLVDTGKDSFKIESETTSGDWLLVTDDDNRTLVYSVARGEMKGSVFGSRPVISPAAGLMGIQNERGQLQIYTLPALGRGTQVSFSSPISTESFSPDGTRLFVLTNDQTFYIFDTAMMRKPDPTASTIVN